MTSKQKEEGGNNNRNGLGQNARGGASKRELID